MTPNEFDTITSKIKHLTNNLCLHVMGEPLLHPNLDEILTICDQKNFNVNIVTNGSLLKEQTAILKKHKSVFKVTISLHSFEANEGEQTLNNYLTNCVNSADTLSSVNKICEFRLWNLNSFVKNGKNSLNNTILNFLTNHYNYDFNNFNFQNKNATLSKNIFLGTDEIFDWPSQNKKSLLSNGFCFGLRTHFAILVDGTVAPCCLDNEGSIKLGNIFNENIDEILNGERTKKIYNGFSNRKPVEELCKHCTFIERFNK